MNNKDYFSLAFQQGKTVRECFEDTYNKGKTDYEKELLEGLATLNTVVIGDITYIDSNDVYNLIVSQDDTPVKEKMSNYTQGSKDALKIIQKRGAELLDSDVITKEMALGISLLLGIVKEQDNNF